MMELREGERRRSIVDGATDVIVIEFNDRCVEYAQVDDERGESPWPSLLDREVFEQRYPKVIER